MMQQLSNCADTDTLHDVSTITGFWSCQRIDKQPAIATLPGARIALNEYLCPIRRHKRLKYMQAARSSSQRIKRSKSWYHVHELGRPSRQSKQWMLRARIALHTLHANKHGVRCIGATCRSDKNVMP